MITENYNTLRIQPREKLLQTRSSSLTEKDLFKIIISSGNAHLNLDEISRNLWSTINGDLKVLINYEVSDFLKIKGIGLAKACALVASLELAKRAMFAPTKNLFFKCSKDVYSYMYTKLVNLPVEEFWVLCVNQHGKLINTVKLSSGGITTTVVDLRLLFNVLIKNLATSCILVHNHPSGQLNPSKADKLVTRKIIKSGKLLDIQVLDHLIIADNNYFSFADNNLLN